MTFKLIIPDRMYLRRLIHDRSEGYCLGMCVTWLLDLLEDRVDTLRPPDIDRGKRYQMAYVHMCEKHPLGGNAANMYKFKTVAYSAKNPPQATALSRSIEEETAPTPDQTIRLIDKLVSMKKNGFLLMSCQGAAGGHAMVLMKKKNGGIYLYDPNDGVYKYSGDGWTLYPDIVQHIFATLGKEFADKIGAALLLTTTHDLKINKV